MGLPDTLIWKIQRRAYSQCMNNSSCKLVRNLTVQHLQPPSCSSQWECASDLFEIKIFEPKYQLIS